MKRFLAALAVILLGVSALPARAEEPVILAASATSTGGTWRFDVMLAHPDTGWDHYADGWEVLDANGTRLAYRLLHHPHVTEQPFTRSLGNVTLPEGTQAVFLRAHCSRDGWGAQTVRVDLDP